jgi:signal transduction histidine kinase
VILGTTENDELHLLRALLRASDYGVLLSDSARRDRIGNKRFCELFGMDSLDTLLAHPDYVRRQLASRLKDPEGFVRTLDEIYADPKRVVEDEVELTAPRPRLLRRFTAPVLSDDGAVIGRLWTFLDITRARGMEAKIRAQAAQLKEQSRQLAAALKTVTGRLDKVENALSLTQQQLFETEKLSAVGLLAASVAHDIRNILTPFTIELALADQDDPPARAEALEAMRRQVDSLALLTHRLLALARPDKVERMPTDLAALVKHIAQLVRSQAVLENVQIVTVASPRLPLVQADGVQIDQVLVNLVLNAVQAMRATGGGTLTVALDGYKDGARVRVADTGPGIPPAHRGRLFDPFFTTRPDGAGLGLFSCRRIIRAHGGTIGVRARPGGGTQFTVWLPCAHSPEGDTPP